MTDGRRRPAHNRQTPESFWARVDMSGGPDACWPWIGATNNTGYGSVGWHGIIACAHRVAAFLSGMVKTVRAPRSKKADGHVLHNCDNPPCCNPKHFMIGTYTQNQLDAYAKKRRYARRGHTHTNSKFSPEIVGLVQKQYRKLGSYAAVARLHGVGESTISRLLKGQSYVLL